MSRASRHPVPQGFPRRPNMTSADVADQVIRFVASGPIDVITVILANARERWPGMDETDRQRVRDMLRVVGPFRRRMVRGWLTQEVMEEWQGFADWVEGQP